VTAGTARYALEKTPTTQIDSSDTNAARRNTPSRRRSAEASEKT